MEAVVLAPPFIKSAVFLLQFRQKWCKVKAEKTRAVRSDVPAANNGEGFHP